MKTEINPLSDQEDRGINRVPCMKTLSIKILVRCWENEYENIKPIAGSELSYLQVPVNPELSQYACTCARKQVAMALKVMVANRNDCGEDLFLPFLQMRCQRELSLLQEKVDASMNPVEKEYYASAYSAWGNVLYTISRP